MFLTIFVYSSVLIFFGFLLRFLIYFPAYGITYLINKQYVKKYDVVDKHRGISHTLFGLFTSVVLFFVLLLIANLYFKLASASYLFLSMVAFFVGANLHLLQDSISKSGIRWFHPFKETKIFGNYSAFVDDSRISILNFALIIVNLLNYFIFRYIYEEFYASIATISVVFVTAVLPSVMLFIIFYMLFRNCQVKITAS